MRRIRFRSRSRAATVGVASAIAAALAMAATLVNFEASAQTAAPPRQPKIIQAGDACARKTDKAQGVVKIDACGRWYCGRADVKDFIELRPKFAEEVGCTWRLEGQLCKCRRDSSPRKGG